MTAAESIGAITEANEINKDTVGRQQRIITDLKESLASNRARDASRLAHILTNQFYFGVVCEYTPAAPGRTIPFRRTEPLYNLLRDEGGFDGDGQEIAARALVDMLAAPDLGKWLICDYCEQVPELCRRAQNGARCHCDDSHEWECDGGPGPDEEYLHERDGV